MVSEIGKLVYGSSPAGHVLFYSLQAATALILILAANTSFTGFPFLVSFVAEDSFLPRKLTVRGHRLVFSNGILLLAGASIALLLATGAKVAALIPMYAIGVFTGFTMAGDRDGRSTTGDTGNSTGARAWLSTPSRQWSAPSSSWFSLWPSSPRGPGLSSWSCPSSSSPWSG